MIVTLICLALLAIGIAVVLLELDEDGFVATCLIVPGVVGLLACFIFIVAAPIAINGDLADYRALQDSLMEARANPAISPMELATIQRDVLDFNRALAVRKYWARNPWTNWFHSKRVFEMNSIR